MNMLSHISAHSDESRGPELLNAMFETLDTDTCVCKQTLDRYEREVGVCLSYGASV